jgi:hypothetical protein
MAGGGDSIRAGVTCVWDAALHRQFEDKTLSPPPVLARDHFAAARGLGDRPMCPGIVAAPRYACEIRDSVLPPSDCSPPACQVIAYTNSPARRRWET